MISLKPMFGWFAEHNKKLKQVAKDTGYAYTCILKAKADNSISMAMLNKICMTYNLKVEDCIRYED